MNLGSTFTLLHTGKGKVKQRLTQVSFRFYRDFEKLLEVFGWPMSIKTANPTLEAHDKFHRTIRNLFRISSSVKSKFKGSPLVESSVFNDEDPLLPIGVKYEML